MKNPHMEKLARLQRQLHRKEPWQLSSAGLWVKTCYAERQPDDLSWWDDVGFVLNRRRVIVWWQHPRAVYADEISERAWELAKPYEPQRTTNLLSAGTPNYRRVGKSRKKIISYTCPPLTEEDNRYFDKLRAIEAGLSEEGIDFVVQPSWQRERLKWATGINLITPFEVRNEDEICVVADCARRLLQGQVTLEELFPGYTYTKADWIAEAEKRAGS